MVKINGYWYNQDEVKLALEKIGYTVVTLEVSTHVRDFPLYETYALKDGAEPNALNLIKSVAVKEFEKPKPELKRPVIYYSHYLDPINDRTRPLHTFFFPCENAESRKRPKSL